MTLPWPVPSQYDENKEESESILPQCKLQSKSLPKYVSQWMGSGSKIAAVRGGTRQFSQTAQSKGPLSTSLLSLQVPDHPDFRPTGCRFRDLHKHPRIP